MQEGGQALVGPAVPSGPAGEELEQPDGVGQADAAVGIRVPGRGTHGGRARGGDVGRAGGGLDPELADRVREFRRESGAAFLSKKGEDALLIGRVGGNGCFASLLIRDKTIAKTLSTSEIWMTAAKQENRQGDQPGWLLPLSVLSDDVRWACCA